MSILVLRSSVSESEPEPEPGDAPQWFLDQASGTWAEIADGTGTGAAGGDVISDCLPSPEPFFSGHNNNANSIIQAWNGGYSDQDNGEYGFCANGGHADWCGNEVYALALRDATPGWRRLIDPTPNGSLGDISDGGGSTYADGRPRAMHNSFQAWGDGHIWMPAQNSTASGGGGFSKTACSFDRETIGAALTPWPYASANPWAFHGAPPVAADGSTLKFGTCCFDKVGHKVWAAAGEGYNNTPFWSIDTDGGTIGDMTGYATGQSGFGNIYAMACAHDLRIIVGLCTISETFGVLDLDDPGAGWDIPSNISGTQPDFAVLGAYSTTQQCMGMVYHAASQSFLLCDPARTGTQIWQLRPPGTIGNGSGNWVWSTATPSGPSFTIGPGNAITYSKLGLIEDMGNGESALVYCGHVDGPTLVFRCPATGI
jgi:hypothetical protein